MRPSHSLPSELSIYTVGELRPQWLTWVDAVRADATAASQNEASFEVDAADVVEVDAAGVQLLLSLSNALQSERRVLKLYQASHPLAQACAALGANALLVGIATTGATT